MPPRRGMRPWKRWICRCGWHSESFRHNTDRIEGQCKVHVAQCQDCRDHGLAEEEVMTPSQYRAERDAARRRVDELEAVCDERWREFTEVCDELATVTAERDEARALAQTKADAFFDEDDNLAAYVAQRDHDGWEEE